VLFLSCVCVCVSVSGVLISVGVCMCVLLIFLRVWTCTDKYACFVRKGRGYARVNTSEFNLGLKVLCVPK